MARLLAVEADLLDSFSCLGLGRLRFDVWVIWLAESYEAASGDWEGDGRAKSGRTFILPEPIVLGE